MAESLFQKLEIAAFRNRIQYRTAESRKWFREKMKEFKNVRRHAILKDEALTTVSRPKPGKMFMFFYDPKLRKTLPYYDSFPLVIMVEPVKGGFYGLNLHYLSPVLRAKLLDQLMTASGISKNQVLDENTKLKIDYAKLKSISKLKAFAPCFKMYLTSQIDSKIVMVEAPEWEIALFLPTEQFAKKNKTHVWGASKRSITK